MRPIKGKLIVDDESYTILRFQSATYYDISRNGMATSFVIDKPFKIEIETNEETNLFAWMASGFGMKNIKIMFSNPSELTKSRTLELYDTLCMSYNCYFDANGSDPFVTHSSSPSPSLALKYIFPL